MKATISFALLIVVAAISANGQYQRRWTILVERRNFDKSPEREYIQKARFRRIDRFSELPGKIREILGKMANPGEPWYNKCVYDGPQLPQARLIFAARSDNHVLVYYETCHAFTSPFRFDIYSFSITGSMQTVLIHHGGGYTGEKARNVEELKSAILASTAD